MPFVSAETLAEVICVDKESEYTASCSIRLSFS